MLGIGLGRLWGIRWEDRVDDSGVGGVNLVLYIREDFRMGGRVELNFKV